MSEQDLLLEKEDLVSHKFPNSKATNLNRAMKMQFQRKLASNPFLMFWAVLIAAIFLLSSMNIYDQFTLSRFSATQEVSLIQLQLDQKMNEFIGSQDETIKQELESMRLSQFSLLQRHQKIIDRKMNPKSEEDELRVLDQIHHEIIAETSENHHTIKKNPKGLRHHVLQQQVTVIQTPQIDPRQYRYITLSNDLRVLIIQDVSSGTASASMCVNAGSWNEPNEWGGLAHFLEHMVFQGSQKYPQMGYFNDLVSRYGGSSNAYTSAVKTNYYFHVGNSGFLDVLDVFAQFFISPLLSEEAVFREVNAVNSEYEIDVAEDSWKLYHLLTLLSHPDHPLNRFMIGNTNTLDRRGVVQALRRFHEQYYSSNQMGLVMKSPRSLDAMESWLRESDFMQITNRRLRRPDYTNLRPPIQRTGIIGKYRLNSNSKSLIVGFQIQRGADQYYRSKPMEFISSMVRSKHSDGLADYIRQNNLGISFYATDYLDSNSAFTLYLIEVVLPATPVNTETGGRSVLEISRLVISYFQTMHSRLFNHSIPTEYYHQYFAERQNLGRVRFRFSEDIPSVQKLSVDLLTFPSEEILSGRTLYTESQPEILRYYIEQLKNPLNLFVLYGDNQYRMTELFSLDEICQNDDAAFIQNPNLFQRSELYRIEWAVKSLTQTSVEGMQIARYSNLQTPELNPYVPENLEMISLCGVQGEQINQSISIPVQASPTDAQPIYDSLDEFPLITPTLVEVEQQPFFYRSREECLQTENQFETRYLRYPQLLNHTLEGKLFWRMDRTFRVPQTYFGIRFQTPIQLDDVRRSALLRILELYLEECLTDRLAYAQVAGFTFQTHSDHKGLSVVLQGWSDKFPRYFREVMQEIETQSSRSPILSGQSVTRLQRVQTHLTNQMANIREDRMYKQLIHHIVPEFLVSDNICPRTLLHELNQITQRDFVNFKSRFLENFRYTAFFTGNLYKEDSELMIEQMREVFQNRSSHVELSRRMFEVVNFNSRSIVVPIASTSSDRQDTNGATLNYYLIGHRDERNKAIMDLLKNKFKNDAYDYLRTQLQLGYVVFAQQSYVGCQDSIYIVVQGTAEPPYVVNKHIDNFLARFESSLQNMTTQDFSTLKNQAIAQVRNRFRNLRAQSEYFWNEIRTGNMEFDAYDVSANLIGQLNQREVIDFYRATFREQTSGKLSLQMYGQGMMRNLGIRPEELAQHVNANKHSRAQSYADREEEVMAGKDVFHSTITRRIQCQHKIGNA